jgi:hypothetical protein
MRTGSVGNRSADDMIRTLVEPKKSTIISARKKLLERGFTEEIEYDAINIEPVLIYSRSGDKVILLRHKWETIAQIPLLESSNEKEFLSQNQGRMNNFLVKDEQGNAFLEFGLPEFEKEAFET